jgi:hypothetical protein
MDEDKKLAEISAKLGISIAVLLESKSKEEVIREYEAGTLQLLRD